MTIEPEHALWKQTAQGCWNGGSRWKGKVIMCSGICRWEHQYGKMGEHSDSGGAERGTATV